MNTDLSRYLLLVGIRHHLADLATVHISRSAWKSLGLFVVTRLCHPDCIDIDLHLKIGVIKKKKL